MFPIVVINVPGLSPSFIQAAKQKMPAFNELAAKGAQLPLRSVFPAVTCPMHATMTTGLPPGEHGIVANGFFDRDTVSVDFWQQSHRLVQGWRFWRAAKKKMPDLNVAVLFWQNIMYSDCDIYLTPAPIHAASGQTVQDCYSKPRDLYAKLVGALGPFQLHWYWGPMVSVQGSLWIADATRWVLENCAPHIVLTYIPQLDYTLQRHGLKAPQALVDAGKVDALIGELVRAVSARGGTAIVVSDYGISNVSGAVRLNAELRKAGLLEIREVAGREYLDLGTSKAFAVVDHQAAHVYCTPQEAAADVGAFLRGVPGVEKVLVGDEKRSLQLDHPRAGEVVAIAAPDKWFAYDWWEDEGRAPDFARTVDIHRKPGFDPLELFADPQTRRLATDHSVVKGSHGRPPQGASELGVFACADKTVFGKEVPKSVNAVEVPHLIMKLAGLK
ncbi:MAG: alkaline phosphatase family protein [Planctomycetota bacterium]|nr:alkaline phosphatase family protein [Planctomycetota bacterium]